MPRNPACQRCPLYEGANSVCVWGHGNPHASIMLVGEGPGEVEDKTGLPFQGSAGKVLDQALAKVGLKREDLWITNVTKCRPPGNRTPLPNESKACFPYLAEEIETVKPKVVIALGGTAIKVLSGRDSVARSRGGVFLEPARGIRLSGSKLLGTYHPAAYLNSKRNPMILQGLEDDLAFAAKIVKPRDKGARGLPEHIATALPPGYSDDNLFTALEELTGEVVAMDCEWTYATDRKIAWPWTRGAQLFSIAVSCRVGDTIKSVAISCPLTKEAHWVFSNWLRRKRVIFHNANADLIWLYNLKLPIRLSGDTMLLAHLFDETAVLKLNVLAESWVGIENWKQPLWSRRPQSQEAWESLLGYNANDTYATILLMEKLLGHLRGLDEDEKVSLARHYKNFMLPATLMFVRMAINGMPLSLEKVKKAIEEHTWKLWQLGEELAGQIGRKTEQALDTAMSPAKVKELLRSQFGLNVDTTNAYVMDLLAEQYPLCELIQKIKHENKLLGTYLKPWAELLEEQGDGRLHSVYSITSTETGRTSAQTEKGATVQLVPRNSNVDRIRDLFEAEEGYLIASADEAQLEMRIAALVAGERTLLGLFQQDFDPHRYLASKINGKAVDDEEYWKTPEGVTARQNAKPAGFGFLYGMQAEKFRIGAKKDYNIVFTTEGAEAIRKAYFELYADFPAWYRRCESQFKKGYVKTLFGRYRRNLPDSNKVCNTLVQTPSTELVMLSLIAFDNWLQQHPELDTHLVGFVHDDAKVLIPDDERGERAIAKLKEIMENPPTHLLGVEELGVPLKAEVHTGKYWP